MRHREIAGQLRHVQGWYPSGKDHRDKLMAEPPPSAMPTHADVSAHGPPIRDQGQRGTCTANSTLEAMGYIYTMSGQQDPLLSRLYTYYYSRKIEGTPATEDSGCQIRNVMKSLAVYGSCLETTWPYSDDTVQFTLSPPHDCFMEAQDHQILVYYRCPSLTTIKRSLADGFPVVGGFQCPANMFTATCTNSGIIQFPSPTEGFEGGHAVLFVGFDDSKKQLKLQNSWSVSWGDKGYGYLPYRFITDGLADDFWTIRKEEM